MKNILFLTYVGFLSTTILHAQQQEQPNPSFYSLTTYATSLQRGIELYTKEVYGSASTIFKDIPTSDCNKPVADFYQAACATKLGYPSAEYELVSFLEKYPVSAYQQPAHLLLSNYYFQQGLYKQSNNELATIDVNKLSDEQKSEYYFQQGYALLKEEEPEKALPLFEKGRLIRGKYQSDATYFYGSLLFNNKEYKAALNELEKIPTTSAYYPEIPQYTIQYHLFNKEYDTVLTYGKLQLKDAPANTALLHKCMGDAYYEKGNYTEALKSYQASKNTSNQLNGEDAYRLGYCYMKNKKYEDAITYLQKVASTETPIGQNAYYQLGYAYVQTKQSQYAINAYQKAAQVSYDKDIKEDALFNYAKLSYELSNDPYNKSIIELENYLENNASSAKATEAQQFLVSIYTSTKNYKQIISTTEKSKTRSETLKKAYQRATYFRGQEVYNDGKYTDAIALFQKSVQSPIDKSLEAQAHYFSGEGYYKLQKYEDAIKQYVISSKIEGGNNAHTNLLNYNIGYSYFNLKDYATAAKYLEKAKSEVPANYKEEAAMRLADSYFMQKNYTKAATSYQQAAVVSKKGSDYALFQESICLGLANQPENKIAILEKLIKNTPQSEYVDDAYLEIATTYTLMGKEELAQQWYTKITTLPTDSPLKYEAMNQMAQNYYNKDENDKALTTYQQILKESPNSSYAKDAIAGVKRIYLEQGKGAEYATYLQSIGITNISTSELDSIAFESGEKLYLKGDCKGAITGLNNYIQKYPTGFFVLDAYYEKSMCERKENQFEAAISSLTYFTTVPTNKYTEQALYNLLEIDALSATDNKRMINAATQLEKISTNVDYLATAYQTLMQAYYIQKDYAKAVIYAEKLTNNERINENTRNYIQLVKGLYLEEQKKYTEATSILQPISKQNSILGAEAYYNLAAIAYKQANYTLCEKTIFELSEKMSSYDYWVAKAFILLGDNYIKQNNTFQAKETYKSVADNYEGPELKKIAQDKYNALLSKKKGK